MGIKPHTIDIVVTDMAASLKFYRMLGLDAPSDQDDEGQVQIVTPNAPTIGLVTETMVRQSNADWVSPVGQRSTFSCKCDSAEEVNETYKRMAEAGYGLKEPWDAFWGQRYAFLRDPDGNRVDIFAPIADHGQE